MRLRVHVRRLRDTALSALQLLQKVSASVNFHLEICSEDKIYKPTSCLYTNLLLRLLHDI